MRFSIEDSISTVGKKAKRLLGMEDYRTLTVGVYYDPNGLDGLRIKVSALNDHVWCADASRCEAFWVVSREQGIEVLSDNDFEAKWQMVE